MTHNDSTLAGNLRRSQPVTALMGIVAVIVLIQVWSVAAAAVEHLSARAQITWPTFVTSLLCLAVNLGLLNYLYQVGRKE